MTPTSPFSDGPPYEGRWPKYRREVREAVAFLLKQPRATIPADYKGDCAAAYEWTRSSSRSLPPEPSASRARSLAIMLHRAQMVPTSTKPTARTNTPHR